VKKNETFLHAHHCQQLSRVTPSADGPLASYKPESLAEIRLISSGKFIENPKTLQGEPSSFESISPSHSLSLSLPRPMPLPAFDEVSLGH